MKWKNVAIIWIAIIVVTAGLIDIASSRASVERAEQIHASGKYQEAVAMLNNLASRGDAKAANRLATIYWGGEGVPPNLRMTLQILNRLVTKGDTTAMARLGLMYQFGEEVPKDLSKAVELYEKSSNLGNREGTTYLALMYRDGTGVPKDTARAISLLNSAASDDNRANRFLGECYQFGNGVPKDLSRARQLYEQAAKLGNDTAQDLLGRMYRDGIGVNQDNERAVELFKKACDKWAAQGAFDLAFMYRDGLGVERDQGLFVKTLERSANQGFPEAEHALAHLYLGGDGVPKDLRKALRLFEHAARFGWAEPENDVGNLLWDHGIDGQRDYERAFEWYLKSAKHGSAAGQMRVAEAYRLGKGIVEDQEEAASWAAKSVASYRTSASNGDSESQYRLAKAYHEGVGVPENKAEARRWYEKAIAQGHPHACNQLATMLLNVSPLRENRDKAMQLFRKGAEDGCPFAQLNLATRYDFGGPNGGLVANHAHNGFPVMIGKRNVPAAIHWYLKAEEQGNETAAYYLGVHYELGDGVPRNAQAAKFHYDKAPQTYRYARARVDRMRYPLQREYADLISGGASTRNSK